MPRVKTSKTQIWQFCLNADHVPSRAQEFHEHCPGAITRPNGAVSSCSCPCHDGKEIEPLPAVREDESVLEHRLAEFTPGKRDSVLMDEMVRLLAIRGELELEPPVKDQAVLRSLRERCYTAGKKAGVKVKARVLDGRVVAHSI